MKKKTNVYSQVVYDWLIETIRGLFWLLSMRSFRQAMLLLNMDVVSFFFPFSFFLGNNKEWEGGPYIFGVWRLDRQGNLGGDILSKLIRQSKHKNKIHHLTSHYDETKDVLL